MCLGGVSVLFSFPKGSTGLLYLPTWLISKVNVGKYTSLMDPIGVLQNLEEKSTHGIFYLGLCLNFCNFR